MGAGASTQELLAAESAKPVDVSDLTAEQCKSEVVRLRKLLADAAAAEAAAGGGAAKPNVMFVLGGPGAGKGTACARLVEETGGATWAHLSAGDCLRAERNDPKSENGELINNYIKEGKIVPVEITIKLVLAAVKAKQATGTQFFMIDGFPRNKDNYDGWFTIAGDSTTCLGCIFMECPFEALTAVRREEAGGGRGGATSLLCRGRCCRCVCRSM
jgi:UMP-CMP kinase